MLVSSSQVNKQNIIRTLIEHIMDNLIIVTNWDKVDKDDFYLSDKWKDEAGEDSLKQAKELQEKGELYEAYIVRAVDYAIYGQLDSDQVFVNDDCDVIVNCESQVINSDHEHRAEFTM